MKYKTIIGVITYRPHYMVNGKQINLLSQCLESIYKNTDMKDTFIIVANNSEDEQIIKDVINTCSKYPNITLLNFEKNLGTTAARNIITRYYDNDITVILDDDVMVYPHWLEATKFMLEKHPDIGTISYDLWYTNSPFDCQIPDNAKIWANECIFPNGSAFAFRRDVFEKIGGFDEQFFISIEEVDFGFRLIQAGYFNYIIGTSNELDRNEYHFVRHIGGATGYPSTNSQEKWMIKHNILFPLNPEMEERIKKERNKNLTLILPRIINKRVIRITTKLNIICDGPLRSIKEPEWTDIDICYLNGNIKLDFITDNSIEVIESISSIEHINNYEYKNVFREFYRILKPGGNLHIKVPDLLWSSKKIIEHSGDLDKDPIRRYLYGDQSSPYQYYHTGFTKVSITKDLKDVGFSDISAQQGIWHNEKPYIDVNTIK